VAATWLACGLNPDKVLFYRQSAIPETFDLTTILMCFTAKGLMNRAHAYKASVADNIEKDNDPDFGINMGLFSYPVLMAADILLFDTNFVPVGKDQKQHVEMAADIAQTLNHTYQTDALVIPEPLINESTQIVTGLDGRKMSKSYNNAIALFSQPKELKKTIMKIVTNSQAMEEPKDPDACSIFSLYKLFASAEQQQQLRARYVAGGMGWGHAKQELYEVLNSWLTPMREKYDQFIADKPALDKILAEGAEKARVLAAQKVNKIRKLIGIG